MNLKRLIPRDKPRAKKALWLMTKWGAVSVAVVLSLGWLVTRPFLFFSLLSLVCLVWMFFMIYEQLDEEDDLMPDYNVWHHEPKSLRKTILKVIEKNEKENEK